MNKLFSAALAATMLALAACSTAPAPVRVVAAPSPTTPSMAPYEWTQGNAAKATAAMAETFGKTTLAPGEYLWAATIPAKGETRILVDLYKQMAYVYRAEQLVGVASISSGKKGKETPLGFWSVLEKKRLHLSRKYDSAPMPFMQRIDEYGIALHAGKTPGYPASHGCVRMPPKFAERLYALTTIGSKVIIEG